MNVRHHAHKILVPILLGSALQGCGGGDDEAVAVADTDPDIEIAIDGSVGDGPVAGAQVVVKSNTGAVLQDVASTQLAGYSVTLKTKGKYFPLFVEATGGTDMITNQPPDFALRSSALEPRGKTTANINPFTTLAMATAEQMDGLTSSTITTALGTVTTRFNSGLSTLAAGGVMDAFFKQKTAYEMVKSSE